METTRQEYDRLTGMSEELARMQREFIVKCSRRTGAGHLRTCPRQYMTR